MSASLLFALACAIIAIAYGVVSIKWIMATPTGNERMREIAAAVQQGASAYLKRQYMTIGLVGVVLFLVIGFSPIGWPTAIGFAIGAILSGAAGLDAEARFVLPVHLEADESRAGHTVD